MAPNRCTTRKNDTGGGFFLAGRSLDGLEVGEPAIDGYFIDVQ